MTCQRCGRVAPKEEMRTVTDGKQQMTLCLRCVQTVIRPAQHGRVGTKWQVKK